MPRSTSSKGLAKGGRRLIRLVNSRSTPSNTTPSASASPSPTPGITLILSRTSPLSNPDGSPFSSPRIQTPVFNSEQSPQLDVDAGRKNSPNLDSLTEVNSTRRGKTQIWPDRKGLFCPEFHGKVEKYARKLSETQTTQSTQAIFDGSTPSTPSEPSYDEQMKIWIDANGLTKQGRLCGFGPEGDIYTNSQVPCYIQNYDSLSKSEDGGEDDNDGGGGGGGADE
ncbi:hypothetical protein Cgig2_016327 [Carnegiea gigantea]|uniref:Uncharacterized protein n=1 Tax=Carnegiea gigantea TaxID=171969 RepID=A0A9Q1JQP5_9CARY|nr:hypothetical protein Cgig2_016327 [Carnegiea gigantea]